MKPFQAFYHAGTPYELVVTVIALLSSDDEATAVVIAPNGRIFGCPLSDLEMPVEVPVDMSWRPGQTLTRREQ